MVIWMNGPSGGHAQHIFVPLTIAHVLSISNCMTMCYLLVNLLASESYMAY